MESPFLTRKDRKTRTKCGTGDLFSYLYSPSVHTDTWTFIFSFVMNIGTNPSVPMDTRIFYLAKSRYEHLNHDRQICFTGESEEGYLLSEKIRDKKIFTR